MTRWFSARAAATLSATVVAPAPPLEPMKARIPPLLPALAGLRLGADGAPFFADTERNTRRRSRAYASRIRKSVAPSRIEASDRISSAAPPRTTIGTAMGGALGPLWI